MDTMYDTEFAEGCAAPPAPILCAELPPIYLRSAGSIEKTAGITKQGIRIVEKVGSKGELVWLNGSSKKEVFPIPPEWIGENWSEFEGIRPSITKGESSFRGAVSLIQLLKSSGLSIATEADAKSAIEIATKVLKDITAKDGYFSETKRHVNPYNNAQMRMYTGIRRALQKHEINLPFIKH
jgi:hypothetical protein